MRNVTQKNSGRARASRVYPVLGDRNGWKMLAVGAAVAGAGWERDKNLEPATAN